jgi:hypothetical protein
VDRRGRRCRLQRQFPDANQCCCNFASRHRAPGLNRALCALDQSKESETREAVGTASIMENSKLEFLSCAIVASLGVASRRGPTR